MQIIVHLEELLARYHEFEGVMRQAEAYLWILNDQICSILSIPGHQNLIIELVKLQKY